MKNEIKSVLRTDLPAFARKAIRELDGTSISNDLYVEYLASNLIDCDDGKTRRLIINLPPRHIKTLMCSVSFPAWILAHKPNSKILVVTYSQDLAGMIARSIRSIVQAPWFKQVFPTRIMKGHAKAMDFSTTAGGALYATSIDGSITGFGADFIVVDDPHNVSDAGYPKQLERTIDRFDAAIMSRLNNRKKGRVIVVAHRIHDRDLSAHLLASGGWRAHRIAADRNARPSLRYALRLLAPAQRYVPPARCLRLGRCRTIAGQARQSDFRIALSTGL